ncbi:uncharacterized protein LOC134222607 isoform X2 [Armigeres subalbatus]|uniref:uncharacterized protein LOC134222607 isoform X2 n=1 Tax=Armigeres subalbatus TaxID=124917 RepID=UPI002ED1E706
MISDALGDLEKCVDTAGTQLDSLALKITDVEKNLDENDMEGLETGMMELLESVTEVKNEYQNLRKDLQEVQQLQKEMTCSLRLFVVILVGVAPCCRFTYVGAAPCCQFALCTNEWCHFFTYN